MAAYVMAAGAKTPDKVALKVVGLSGVEQVWRYDALRRAILGVATGLLRKGLSPGNIVLMRLGNTVDFQLAYLGALAAGCVPVPTSSALTEHEVQSIINELRPSAILRDPEVPCPADTATVALNELRGFYDLPPAQPDMGDPDRLGYIVYTSGTSGQPRAVAHAHRAIWARRMMFDGWYGLTPSDCVMHAGAFNWTYTLGTGLMDPWTIGAVAVIPAVGTRPADLPQLMREHDVTIFAAAPGVYRQMLDHAADPSVLSLRHGLSAGEKLPDITRDRFREKTGLNIYEAYGMSECSTFISQAPGDNAPPNTLGQPQAGRRVALLRDGKPVPKGEEGTIAIHKSDPGLMLGYFNAASETEERFCRDWFLTGDQGAMDAAGFIS